MFAEVALQAAKKTTNVREALRARAGLAIEPGVSATIDGAAVAAGRQPLAAPRQAAPEGGSLSDAGSRSIDSRFRFSAAESDREYNYRHVEPLLDRAAMLLDRCAGLKARLDGLQIEGWKLHAEFDLLARLEDVAAKEREAGADTLGYERAALAAAAEQGLEENHRHAGDQLKDLMNDLVASGLNRRMAARELAAWISAWPLKDAELRGDDANYTFDGARKTKPEHLFEAARQEADEDAWEQIYSLMFQRYSAMAESEAARLRRQSLEAQAKWDLADIGFRRARAQAARDAAAVKVREAQTVGSLLNYSERIGPAGRLFTQDFREAIACLTAARRGLKELFNYAPEFPQEGTPGYLDAVEAWTAAARNRMAQLSQQDQDYVLVLSLKQLTHSGWEAGRAASEWSFDLPAGTFAGQTGVRLRGVSLSLTGPLPEAPEAPKGAQKVPVAKPETLKPETAKAEGFWWARVTAPASVPCFLGRVADRESAREPEIAGSRALLNVSPVGAWKVTLAPKSTDGMVTEKLQDAQLWLHVSVRGDA